MPPIASKLQALTAVIALAVAANIGIATASASTHPAQHTTHHGKSHHGKSHHARSHRRHELHKAKHVKKEIVAEAASTKATNKKTPPTASKPPAISTSAPADPISSNGTPSPVGIAGSWNLVLDSEFNTSSLNTNLWRTGWFGKDSPINSEEDDCYSPNNVTFPGDGSMHMAVTATSSTCNGVTYPYTGSAITTDPNDGRTSGGFQYTYGVVEADVYVPADGTQIANWPAVWADGEGTWPNTGEDDVMEGLGGKACYHFHDPLGGPGECDATLTPGWHTFASDWQPGSVTYYYDGVKVGAITTGITSDPMYLIIDNTVYNGTSTNTEADAIQVKYVRVWQS